MKIAPAIHRSLPAPAVEPDEPNDADLPTELTERHHELIEVLVWGSSDPRVEELTRPVVKIVDGERRMVDRPLRKGEPLLLSEAAQLLGFRQRNARKLMATPLLNRAYSVEMHHKREGGKPRALEQILSLIDEPGQGKAADRKVQLEAAKAILGDQIGPTPARGPTINVNSTITAGYVIRLPTKPGEEPHTIDRGAAGSIVYEAEDEG